MHEWRKRLTWKLTGNITILYKAWGKLRGSIPFTEFHALVFQSWFGKAHAYLESLWSQHIYMYVISVFVVSLSFFSASEGCTLGKNRGVSTETIPVTSVSAQWRQRMHLGMAQEWLLLRDTVVLFFPRDWGVCMSSISQGQFKLWQNLPIPKLQSLVPCKEGDAAALFLSPCISRSSVRHVMLQLCIP